MYWYVMEPPEKWDANEIVDNPNTKINVFRILLNLSDFDCSIVVVSVLCAVSQLIRRETTTKIY